MFDAGPFEFIKKPQAKLRIFVKYNVSTLDLSFCGRHAGKVLVAFRIPKKK